MDRWLGIPLCFAFSLLSRVRRLFGTRSAEAQPPRRILFIGMAEIGGLLVAYPALRRARKLFPDAEIYFLSFAMGRDILELMGIDDAHQVLVRPDSAGTFIADTFKTLARLRRARIDTTINLETFARYSTLLAFWSGAWRRAGFHRFRQEGNYVGDLVTHRVIYNPHIHASQTFVALVESLLEVADGEPRMKRRIDETSPERLQLSVGADERDVALEGIRDLYPHLSNTHKLILVNANASDLVPVRRWPTENYVELIRRLLEDRDVLIVLTGAPNEDLQAKRLEQAVSDRRVLNMVGRTTLKQLIHLYAVSDLLITNDSGPGHFVSVTDTPAIVLFGPETPRIYGPLSPRVEAIYLGLACSPCVSVYNQKRSPCGDNQCMKRIPVDQVLERARDIVDRSAPAEKLPSRPRQIQSI